MYTLNLSLETCVTRFTTLILIKQCCQKHAAKTRRTIASLGSGNNIHQKKSNFAIRTEQSFCIMKENVVACLKHCASVPSLGSNLERHTRIRYFQNMMRTKKQYHGYCGTQKHCLLKKTSYPCNRPWRPAGLWEVDTPTFSIQSAHRWRWGYQPYAPATFYP
jgi:hypothetical protein